MKIIDKKQESKDQKKEDNDWDKIVGGRRPLLPV